MRKHIEINIQDIDLFKKKIIVYASQQNISCILNSNSFSSSVPGLKSSDPTNFLAAIDPISIISFKNNNDPFDQLYDLWKLRKDWYFGHLSYDLKNRIENLQSNHPDNIGFDEISFFVPGIVIEINNKNCTLWHSDNYSKKQIDSVLNEINKVTITPSIQPEITINKRTSAKQYFNDLHKIKQHIQNGDIYEVNYCQEFYADHVDIEPSQTYITLCDLSPAPFSCLYRQNDKILISASPERFLKKSGQHIYSQPMKGTAGKGENEEKNKVNKLGLSESIKEKSENIMIVDLVRNDLSKTAKPGSVQVAELCKIYEFPQVYQMISTIRSEINPESRFTDSIRSCFPMGSMTGAPKIRAMEIIEEFEKTKRGLFSGSVGYINPMGDFDFNVIIRSIQYNQATKYISFITGGAITILSDPEKEYNECLIKAKGILKSLNATLVENI